jgi:hypothetical protein
VVVLPLYSQVIPPLSHRRKSTVTSILMKRDGCGPPCDQSTHVTLRLAAAAGWRMWRNVDR